MRDLVKKLCCDVVSAFFWTAVIVVIMLFSNVSSTQFIYNQF